MCCFRLHFSDFNVLLKKKTCCSLLWKKITYFAKRENEITFCEEKSQPPPPPPDIKWSVPYVRFIAINSNLMKRKSFVDKASNIA